MNQGWEIRPLQDICNKASSNLMQKNIDSENGMYPVFGASGIAGYIDYYVQAKDYIGIIKDGSGVGRVNIYPKESSLLGTLQYIIPNENMDLRYVAYALKSMNLTKYVSGAAIPHIYFRDYGKEKIAVPSIKAQGRIADELDKLNELIEIKRSQLKDLDALAQSLFYETFGDPIENPMRWDVGVLSDYAVFKNGLNFTPTDNGNKFKCLGVSDFKTNRYIKTENLSEINIVESVPEDYLLKKYDLILVRSNGNKALIGRSIMYVSNDSSATFSGFCIRCRYNREILSPLFLSYYLSSRAVREYITSQGRGCNISNLNQKILSSIPLMLPPLSLQNQFASKIEAIEAQKKRVEASIADLETLLASRMDYWFND